MARLLGKPLIEHVYARALEARTVSRVIVATDDQRILDTVVGFGGEAILTGTGHRSGSDRLGEVAGNLEADVLVNVQGDEPLIDPAVIDSVVRAHGAPEPPDIATVAVPILSAQEYSDRHIVKVVTDKQGSALYFSRSPIPSGWQEGSGVALRHVGIYAYSREALLKFVSLPVGELEEIEDLEQLRALENGMRIHVVKIREFHGAGVDRPEDLLKVEKLMMELKGEVEGVIPGRVEGGP